MEQTYNDNHHRQGFQHTILEVFGLGMKIFIIILALQTQSSQSPVDSNISVCIQNVLASREKESGPVPKKNALIQCQLTSTIDVLVECPRDSQLLILKVAKEGERRSMSGGS